MASKSHPTDQYHIAKCESFCNAVEQIITADEQIQLRRDDETGRRCKRLTYIEAVLTVAEKQNIEPDLAAAYLNPQIKEKLRIDYENIHWLPRTASLPFFS